ncbi:MAG: glycosyltransferase family 1 protein [Anaerolineae bacterium]|nr:glycosyltransferase family 1 protein [Anaerolineae bacterium]
MHDSWQRPIHVALNAHLLSGDLSYRSAGVHQYISHLLVHLPQAGCRVTAFVGPRSMPVAQAFSLHYRRTLWPTHRPAARVLWEQLAQGRALQAVGADLVHGPVFVGPLAAPCPVVITVHDLSFLRYPHLFRPANRLYLRLFTRLSVRRARRVIAVSNHAARETVRLLGVAREKLRVVYHGVDPIFRPLPPEEVAAFRARRGLPERFVLFVGTLEPRKNLVRLIEAFARAGVDAGADLVLVGARGWYDEEVFAAVERWRLSSRVHFPGYVPNDELPLWYNAAWVFAYPSLYEGFGLPILEAQACGTPVLTSSVSALPEAAGNGALMVDPYDPEAIADGLHRLLTDRMLREELRQRGLEHATRFSWARTAAETVAVYQEAIAGGKP